MNPTVMNLQKFNQNKIKDTSTLLEKDSIRIRFGRGSLTSLSDDLKDLKAQRVVLICTPSRINEVLSMKSKLGELCVGVYDQATQHIPQDIAQEALDLVQYLDADWVLSYGGGTATGLAKAVACMMPNPISIACIPTTYAGSERTSIWGIKTSQGKQVGRDERARPQLICYDPQLTDHLPLYITIESLLNAFAQAIALLMAPELPNHLKHHPDWRKVPLEAVMTIVDALKMFNQDSHQSNAHLLLARDQALYGAYLAAGCLEQVPLGLHHALAHTLGGIGVRHSLAHAAMIPHSLQTLSEHLPHHAKYIRDTLNLSETESLKSYLESTHDFQMISKRLQENLSTFGFTSDRSLELAQKTWARHYHLPVALTLSDLNKIFKDLLS